MSSITVYTAKKIVTMNPSAPVATAVAVRDGMILGVGSLEDLQPWIESGPHEIVRDFEDKVLLPGLIDPHLHPFLAATALYAEIIAAFEWKLPWGTFKPIRGKDAYLAELRRIEKEKSGDEPLITWGYHQFWHGQVTRTDLDAISTSRPLVVWHRSTHEMICSTAALEHWNMTESAAQGNEQIDYAKGHYWEAGFVQASAAIAPFLFGQQRYLAGTERVRDMVHFGGITTVAELSFGISDPDLEWFAPSRILDRDDVPFRTLFVTDLQTPARTMGVETAFAWTQALPQRNTKRLRFIKHVKLFADGAFFSQNMMLGGACYIDGHHGAWMTPPPIFHELAAKYWDAGYQLHVHTNGDEGLQFVLDTLQQLLDRKPRFDHRFTIEHFGYATPDQIRRIDRLGAIVSANPYYIYELGDVYSKMGMGADRASQMCRAGSVARAGIPLALHSDCPMAPARPLLLAQVAATRLTAEGTQLRKEERLSIDEALKAITLDAAFTLGVENEIGSIVSGKKADFTVLEADPYVAGAEGLAGIPIWGTVFEGTAYPVSHR
jgi:predicted amidohydrolase YtcJ